MRTSGRAMGTTRAGVPRSDPAVSYDEFKEYEGRKYTGMKIGRSHKWYSDEGEWKETKLTPDLWQISYAVTKRRAGRAPEGSGVPVGTVLLSNSRCELLRLLPLRRRRPSEAHEVVVVDGSPTIGWGVGGN